MRRAARTDNNHAMIREAFRTLGWAWADTFRLGQGFPDGVVSKSGVNILIEVKSADGKLTDDEAEFAATWRGPYEIVRSVEDVERIEMEWRAK